MTRAAAVPPRPPIMAVAVPSDIPPGAMQVFSRLALSEGGLAIGPDRTDFLVARLGPRLARLGLADFAAYAARLDDPGAAAERRLFIESLTTHTTSFFRESAQFDWMRDTGLPSLVAAGAGTRRELVLWSAACSTGQELYSALMTVAALRPPGQPPLLVRGHGTDLSEAVLRRCEQAIYSREEIAGIPEPLRRRFLLSARDDPDRFRIVADLRGRARWTQANLVRAGELGGLRADIAMLRNVLIYFDAPTRARVLQGVIGLIRPGGYLLTGHSETIPAPDYGLAAVRPSIYRKEP